MNVSIDYATISKAYSEMVDDKVADMQRDAAEYVRNINARSAQALNKANRISALLRQYYETGDKSLLDQIGSIH